MSDAHPERRRLQKGDADLIKAALEVRGFTTRKSGGRVEAFDEDDNYVCGFYWQSAKKFDDPLKHSTPAGWRFDLCLSFAFSVKDLKSALTEAKRVRKLRPRLLEAWIRFSSSRSVSRWRDYRGHVAALFMRSEAP